MADLTPAETTADPCCAPAQQATCCEPSAKAECCGHGNGCGCDAASDTAPASDVRGQVRERYAAAARAAGSEQAGCGCGVGLSDEHGRQVFGGTLYDGQNAEGAQAALTASLGCGVPTAVADLAAGATVLDLGSGAGADVLIYPPAESAQPARRSAWI